MTSANAKEKQIVIIRLSDGLGFSHSDIIQLPNGAQCKNVSTLLEPRFEFKQSSYNNIIFGVGESIVAGVKVIIRLLTVSNWLSTECPEKLCLICVAAVEELSFQFPGFYTAAWDRLYLRV